MPGGLDASRSERANGLQRSIVMDSVRMGIALLSKQASIGWMAEYIGTDSVIASGGYK